MEQRWLDSTGVFGISIFSPCRHDADANCRQSDREADI
jgi:hypothetical protein